VEINPHPTGAGRTGGSIRDDLENHWLLVGCAMDRSGAQQPDIIRLAEKSHQVVDEPARRRAPRLSVFQGDDHVKTPSRICNPTPFLESPKRRFKCQVRDHHRFCRFGTGKGVTAPGLKVIYKSSQ
jgi:hypothetical protein